MAISGTDCRDFPFSANQQCPSDAGACNFVAGTGHQYCALQSLIQYLGQLDYLPYSLYDYLPSIFMVLFVWQSLAVVWVFARELKWHGGSAHSL